MKLDIGSKLKDNDPRCPNRVLTVTDLGVRTESGLQHVFAKGETGPKVRILVRRIHADGKPRRSGFDLVDA